MSATQPILNDIAQYLKENLPEWDVELFPNNPGTYSLSHINGAVLISYLASKFEKPRTTEAVLQTRHVQVALTVLTRDLHDDEGALNLLDKLRLLMVGFRPVNCTECWLVDEFFNGTDEETGIWQYQLILQTETQQVQQIQAQDLPKFVTAHLRRADQPVRPDLKPKKP
ncbi:Gp37 family protein [Exercitatus varius]|uniref:Gp37 family protein n=1 Tax=Exercitatus varius TaxID=67857 RepID=UPI00294B9A08|nr:Gp37 family protein [Exercitatus varius]MDG2958875.1 Gp37 family protein [Exercitatus varius]